VDRSIVPFTQSDEIAMSEVRHHVIVMSYHHAVIHMLAQILNDVIDRT
jgi:hypothetical protein